MIFTVNIIVIILFILASIMFMIGSGLFISAGKLLKSNEFGRWSCDDCDYADKKVVFEHYRDEVSQTELDEFISEFGDTKNWR